MACPAVTQKIITVDGIDTQVCILEFSDRMIINITQKKRIAALVAASANDETTDVVFDVKILFGDRKMDAYKLLSKALLEKLYSKIKKPILFGLSFENDSFPHLSNLKTSFLTEFEF